MSPESSLFTPGQPVPIEFFVGRVQEIERLRSLVQAAARGKFKIGFVTGERGIGKTSLVSFVRHLSEKDDRVAGAHVFLGGAKDVPDMIRRTLDRLLKENVEKPWYGKLKDFFGKRIEEVGLFGISVQLKLTQNDLQQLMHEFVPTIRRLLSQLKGERKAFLLILDDINGLADSAEFANWLKSTVDEIATGPEGLNLCLLIVGLEERRQGLLALQPSLDRVFDLTEIRPWDAEETGQFYTETFSERLGHRRPRSPQTDGQLHRRAPRHRPRDWRRRLAGRRNADHLRPGRPQRYPSGRSDHWLEIPSVEGHRCSRIAPIPLDPSADRQ